MDDFKISQYSVLDWNLKEPYLVVADTAGRI